MASEVAAAIVSARRSRRPRRKQRTAGATPSRVSKRHSGQSRSVLEALLAGDSSDRSGGEEEEEDDDGKGRSSAGEKERAKSALERKRRRKERPRVRRRVRSAEDGGQRGEPAAEPDVDPESDKENGPRRESSQPNAEEKGRGKRKKAASSGSSQSESDGDDEEAPGVDGGGSPVVQKRLFASAQATSSEDSDVPSDSAGDEAVDEAEERRNYRRFVAKYAAAASASVLEAVTPRDAKKKARRAEPRVLSPLQEADASVLSQGRSSEVQYRDTDDELDDEDWLAGGVQVDDDKHDPTYNPAVSERRASLRSAEKKKQKKKSPAPKTEKAVKAGRSKWASSSKTDPDTAIKAEQRRKWTRSTVLTNWSVEWPLHTSAPGETKARGLQLVLVGAVSGKPARFQVAKRLSATHFTSSANVSVVLDGPFTENPAEPELPPGFVELVSDGIPAHWKTRLAAFLPAGVTPPSKPKAKRSPETRERGVRTPKTAKGSSREKEPAEPMTPVMKWWRADASASNTTDSLPAKKSATAKKTAEWVDREKPTAKKPPLARRSAAAAAKSTKSSSAEPDDWTAEQLEALDDAKLKIPTTAANFWAEVANFVPGKTSAECRARSFALYSTPPGRKSTKGKKRALDASVPRVPSKVARAGTNKFKKQVREFVEEYEKKNVDDIFAGQETPLKAPSLSMDFDSLTSPTMITPQKADSSGRDGDESEDAPTPGLLTKLTASKRDDVDSYVLGIKRRHTGIAIGAKAVRTTGLSTPTVAAKKKKVKAVHMKAEVGTHMLEGVVSPGGTTRVRIGKDGSSSEDEDDELDDDEDDRGNLSDF